MLQAGASVHSIPVSAERGGLHISFQQMKRFDMN
jgi:hypothetical protein